MTLIERVSTIGNRLPEFYIYAGTAHYAGWHKEANGLDRDTVCVIFDLLSRYMRSVGPWQRLRRCSSNGGGFFTYPFFPRPQTDRTGHSRVSVSLPPSSAKIWIQSPNILAMAGRRFGQHGTSAVYTPLTELESSATQSTHFFSVPNPNRHLYANFDPLAIVPHSLIPGLDT